MRTLRRGAGLSQRQAADLAGLSVAALRDLEQGRVAAPRPATLRRLAEALRLPAADAEELLRYAQPGQLPATDLWLQVLGPVAVQVDGVVVEVGSARQRLLLGTLALAANTPVSQDRLIETIWGHRPPPGVAELLRMDASRLRRRVAHQRGVGAAPDLVAAGGGYQLVVSENQLDLLLFRQLVQDARRSRRHGDPARACRLLAEAVALWRGDPVADLAPLRQDAMALGLAQEWQAAVVAYAETATELGQPADVLPLLRRVVEVDPLHEPAYAQLLVALADSGQPALAVRMFDALRRRLAEELGTDPGPELLQAYQLARDRNGAQREASTVTVRRQLPADLAEFTGRAAELRALHERAAAAGGTAAVVLSIMGMGGAGKTRLAVRLAHQLLAAGRYLDAQLYVDLRGHAGQPPADSAAVLAVLLGLLGVSRDQIPPDLPGRSALYRDRLYGKAALVLLDDAASEEQVLPLLPAGPGNLVLITGRRCLALDGAYALPLAGFSPADAERLLARIAGPERVAGDPEATRRLAALCGHLPLAVSLAGRRLRARPAWRPADLVARLAGSGDRLGELAAGSDQLRTVFDRSYRLLGEAERRLFRLLGAEPGEVTAESAAALAGVAPLAARRMLDRLVDEHLATVAAGERYRLPDLLRDYARSVEER